MSNNLLCIQSQGAYFWATTQLIFSKDAEFRLNWLMQLLLVRLFGFIWCVRLRVCQTVESGTNWFCFSLRFKCWPSVRLKCTSVHWCDGSITIIVRNNKYRNVFSTCENILLHIFSIIVALHKRAGQVKVGPLPKTAKIACIFVLWQFFSWHLQNEGHIWVPHTKLHQIACLIALKKYKHCRSFLSKVH